MKFYVFLHILGIVYWLGTDLAVYYSGKFLRDRTISIESRIAISKLVWWLDLFPRFAMPIMIFSGMAIAMEIGLLLLPDYVAILGTLTFIIWLTVVHFAYRGKFLTFDLWFRYIIITGLLLWVLYSLYYHYDLGNRFLISSENEVVEPEYFNPLVVPLNYWMSAKVFFFTLTMFFGVMIRITLKPFSSYMYNLSQNKSVSESEDGIDRCLSRTVHYVHAIWFCILINILLGIHLIHI